MVRFQKVTNVFLTLQGTTNIITCGNCPVSSCVNHSNSMCTPWVTRTKNALCTFSRDTAQKMLTFGESRWCSICACGYSVPQIRTLCTLTLPFIWSVASSQMSLRNHFPPFSTTSRKSRAFSLRLLVSAQHQSHLVRFKTATYATPSTPSFSACPIPCLL